jgi:ADP-heptose:LPS heptosyltransferase
VERIDPFQHAIERRLDFVRLLGADTFDKSMHIVLPPGEVGGAKALLDIHFGRRTPLLVAFHPFGSGRYKWWPLKSFAALGNHLHETYGAALLIVSGPRDRKEAEALATQFSGPALLTGGRPLSQVATLLKHCRLFVGNDSGPLHMALALGVPSIALLGADHPRRVGPYQVNWGTFLRRKEEVCQVEPCLFQRCPDNLCLQAIEVAAVIKSIREWWEPLFLKPKAAAGI